MKKIFERGCFQDYKIYNLEENRGIILEHYGLKDDNPSVFISHKHDDLEDLKGIIGFLQDTYKINNNSICLFPMKEKGKADTLYKEAIMVEVRVMGMELLRALAKAVI